MTLLNISLSREFGRELITYDWYLSFKSCGRSHTKNLSSSDPHYENRVQS